MIWKYDDNDKVLWTKVDGFCKNPDTELKYEAADKDMSVDASAQDKAACE
jgi:hypothetical protein